MSSGEIVISGGTGGNSLKKTPVNNKSRNKKRLPDRIVKQLPQTMKKSYHRGRNIMLI